MSTSESRNVQIGTHPAPAGYRITVTFRGPYKVEGQPRTSQQTIESDDSGRSARYAEGKSFELPATAYLCRCGRTGNAPFCDGSHKTADMDLSETAKIDPLLSGAQEIDGPRLTLTDNEAFCAYARFCDNGEKIWSEVRMAGDAHERLTVWMGRQCPGGRLMVWDRTAGEPIEPREPPTIGLIEDASLGVSGPLMVRGGIAVTSADGRAYEIRNRQALCRCGASANKPFCDGSQARVGYRDGIK